MQKWISPFRIFGRKNSFCSSVPNCMIVGPTVLMVSIGTGAPARIDSSKKMNCSMGPAALAAVLLGPADAEPAVGRHLLDDRRASPCRCRGAGLRLDLGRQQVRRSRRAAPGAAPAAPRGRRSMGPPPGPPRTSPHRPGPAGSDPGRAAEAQQSTLQSRRGGQAIRPPRPYQPVTAAASGAPGEVREPRSWVIVSSHRQPPSHRLPELTRAHWSSAGPTT